MSKVLKTVAIVAIAVAVVVFAPQIAGVLASVAGSLGVTVAATALTSAIVGMGLSLALTAVASAFRKAPSMSQSMADRLNTSVVPSASRKIVFGTTAGGEDVRFFEGDIDLPSSKKDGYVQVIALASHRINAFKSFHADTDLVWSEGSFVTKRDGFAPINPFRVVLEGKPGNGLSVGSGRYWNSTATFTGCAYYVPFWKLDEKVWESGIPQRLTAIVEGCPLYDPRRDSTRGGSGPHRAGNQDTYAFRDGSVEIGRNPALALLTYLLGWRINGKVVWGMGIPANRIDFDNFRTYANLCEEQVAIQGGGSVQRYTIDGIYSTTDSHDTVINGVTATMGSCKLTDRGGTYCLVGGYDDTAGPKVSFDADDLVAPANGSSPYLWNPAPASRERFNIVRGRFANPAELYQLTDWGDPIEQPALADGIPRTMSLDLGGVSRAETCQRIAKQFLLREYLCPGTFSATFGPKAFAVEIGSVITLSLPSEGWNNKLFRVMEQAETHDMFFQMTLREEDPAIYAWDREEKALPPSIRPQGYDASTTITPANLSLTSDSYSGANGVNVSEVHVTWTPELSGRVNGIQIQSRPAGTEAWTEQAALFDPKLGRFTFTSNAPGITVEVQARYRMMSAVYSPWFNASVGTAAVITITDWENVTDSSGTRPDDNATKGAPAGTNVGDTPAQTVADNAKNAVDAVRDTSGNIIVVRDMKAVLDKNTADAKVVADGAARDVATARTDIQNVRTDLGKDITAARTEGTTARQEVAQVRTDLTPTIVATQTAAKKANDDLTAEIARAQSAEGAITTKVTAAQTRADGAHTAISNATTQFQDADRLLSQRVDAVVATAMTDKGTLDTRITNEVATLVGKDDAISRRIDSVVSQATTDRGDYTAKVQQEATTRTGKDDALGVRIDNAVAQANTDRGDYIAKVREETTARVQGDEASGVRSTAIEAAVKAGAQSLLPINMKNPAQWTFNEGAESPNGFGPGDGHFGTNGENIFVFSTNAGDSAALAPVANFKPVAGRTYRVTWKVRRWVAPSGGTSLVHPGFYTRNSDGSGSFYNDNLDWTRLSGDYLNYDNLSYEWTCPSNVSWARPRIHLNNGGSDARYMVSGMTLEDITDVRTTNARITDQVAVLSRADEAAAVRASGLETRMGNQEGYANAINAKVDRNETARSTAEQAIAGRLDNTEANYRSVRGDLGNWNNDRYNEIVATNGRVTNEEAARVAADNATVTQLRTIEASATNAGNLIPNTSLATIDGWSLTSAPNGALMERNGAGDNWQIGGVENNLTLRCFNTSGIAAEAQSARFAVQAGEWYQGYTLTASHRCWAWVSMFWFDYNGAIIGYCGENMGARRDAGNRDIQNHDRTGFMRAQAPAGAIRACLLIRAYDAANDGFAWFHRPYVGKVKSTTNEWNSYTPGPENLVTTSTLARIIDEANASTTRDKALGDRVQKVEADYVTNGAANSIAQAKVNDEAGVRARADEAAATRTGIVETRLAQVPETWRVRAAGAAAQRPANFNDVGVYSPAGVQRGGFARSYTVHYFADGQNVIETGANFDVYGNGEVRYSGGDAGHNNSAAMAGYLNSIPAGRTVIIYTSDEPANNRFDNGLLAAMYRCGAGAAFASPNFRIHGAYILIGRAGAGAGNGMEYYAGTANTDPQAWLDIPFTMVNGRAVMGGQTGVAVTSARLDDEVTARTNGDNAIIGRVQNMEAKFDGNQDSWVAARIRDEAAASAARDNALTTRLVTQESNYASVSDGTVQNPKFANWPDGMALPGKWIYWSTEGNFRIERQGGLNGSPYGVKTLNDVEGANSGFYQVCSFPGGAKWNVTVTARLNANELRGAGVTLSGIYSIDFGVEADTQGRRGNQGEGVVRTWSKTFDIHPDHQTLNVHCMNGWAGFGSIAPKYMTWYELSVRPLNDAGALSYTNSARISTEENTRTNQYNALATRNDALEAQVSNDSSNLLRNGTFNQPDTNWVLDGGHHTPASWNVWAKDGNAYIGPIGRASLYGAKYPLQIDRNGNQNGLYQRLPATAAGWYAVEVDITAEDGNWLGSGFHWNFQDVQGHTIDFGRDQDTNGGVVSGNIGSVNRKFSKLVYVGFAPAFINCYLMAGWEGFATGQGFLRTIWHKVSFRAASEAEIAAKKVLDANIIARVSSNEGAIANVQTKVATAWSEKTVSAGTSAATITMRATDDNGNATSDVTLAASRIALRNTETGGISKGGMVMSGGNAVFDGSITANGGILVGNGKLRVQVQATDYAVSHGQRVDFGYDLGRAPNITFGPCPVALNSGEVYAPYASDLSATGFTAQLVINSAPQSSGQTTGAFGNQGNNTWDGGKQGKPNAANGTYTLTVNLQATATAYREYNEDYR